MKSTHFSAFYTCFCYFRHLVNHVPFFFFPFFLYLQYDSVVRRKSYLLFWICTSSFFFIITSKTIFFLHFPQNTYPHNSNTTYISWCNKCKFVCFIMFNNPNSHQYECNTILPFLPARMGGYTGMCKEWKQSWWFIQTIFDLTYTVLFYSLNFYF